jgi:hypothetical protein
MLDLHFSLVEVDVSAIVAQNFYKHTMQYLWYSVEYVSIIQLDFN